MRRRRERGPGWPPHLAGFREEDWPQVPGECLVHYACADAWDRPPCVPREGEFCGQRCYETLARDYLDRPEVLAAAKTSDAYERFHQARLAWLGEDHPGYLDEFIGGFQAYERIRYEPFRKDRLPGHRWGP